MIVLRTSAKGIEGTSEETDDIGEHLTGKVDGSIGKELLCRVFGE